MFAPRIFSLVKFPRKFLAVRSLRSLFFKIILKLKQRLNRIFFALTMGIGVQKMMEKDSLRTNYSRERTDGNLLRSSSDPAKQLPSSSDFGLQWGTRKRLRCTKNQIKDVQSGPVNRTTVRVDRRVVRTDKNPSNQPTNNNSNGNGNGNGNGYINLRQRPASPRAPPPHRILRNSENFTAMRGQTTGVIKGCASSERGAHDKRGGVGGNRNNNNNHHHHNNNNNDNNHHNNRNNKSATSSDSKKGGSSSGSGESIPLVWPSQFVLSLTNKEKEEDFMIIKGSKPSQRPKKRSKFIQRTLNLVSPGEWLCDISLERYEVREKKISKKRPRGLKAMSNMESDSE